MQRLSHLFHRNQRAGDQLEIFLISAVASLLLVRFYLFIAGYPQIGGDSLHIAHMLWGGLLMLVAQVLLLGFLGLRMQRLAALIGGVGFGVFIDELGKFITKDNDYFYEPTIGLIYAIFVILFITFRLLSRRPQQLSDKERLLNAIAHLEEAAMNDLDESEKKEALQLLREMKHPSDLSRRLDTLLTALPAIRGNSSPNRFTRLRHWIDQTYRHLLGQRYSRRIIGVIFIGEALLLTVVSGFLIITTITDLIPDFGTPRLSGDELLPAIGEMTAAGIAAIVAIWGTLRLTRSRLDGLRILAAAMLIQIFLTGFFQFYREEFAALPAVLGHIVLFIILRAALRAEERLQRDTSTTSTLKPQNISARQG